MSRLEQPRKVLYANVTEHIGIRSGRSYMPTNTPHASPQSAKDCELKNSFYETTVAGMLFIAFASNQREPGLEERFMVA